MIYAIALAGIALTLLAVRLTGGRRQARIVDLPAAARRLAEDRPDLRLSGGLRSADGEVAIFPLTEGLAIVFVVGDRLATRIVARPEIVHVALDAGNTLMIVTDSFTRPVFRLTGIEPEHPLTRSLLAPGHREPAPA